MSKNKQVNSIFLNHKRGTLGWASLFFILSISLYADIEDLRLTEYRFESQGHLKGQCFEIDRRTQGQDYKVPKSEFFCEKLFAEKTTFLIPNKTGLGGECYEVDAQTQGHRFAQRKPYDFCKPPKTSFEWRDNRCFETGRREDNQQYIQSVASEKCLVKVETQNIWVVNKNKLSGSCFRIDTQTQGSVVREMIATDECKPAKTRFVWLQDPINPTRGRCYILDAQLGPEGYVATTADADCLEKENKYSWIQKNPFEGECFELNTTQDDQMVPKKVPASHCTPTDSELVFYRESFDRGYCLERDQKTQGQRFQHKVELKRCKTMEVETLWFETPRAIREGKCLTVDIKTQGMEYLEARPREECLKPTGQYQFELNAKRLEGTCYELIPLGSKQQRKNVPIDRCRPKEVKLVWSGDEKTLIGHCYEIDKKGGAQAFLKRVQSLRCKPFYLEDVEYRFHQAPGEAGGRCFEVDKKTQGLNYAVNAPEEKCRKQLSLPDL